MQASYMTQWILPLALFSIMLGVGMTLERSHFVRLWQQPRALLAGVAGQLLVLPLLGLMVLSWVSLPPALAVGMMILTFAPGGATSNMLTLLARGDTALSISLTAVTSFITPFTLPVLTLWALQYQGLGADIGRFPVLPTIAKVVLVTLVPVMVGMTIAAWRPQLCKRMLKPVKIGALVFMILIVTAIVRANWDGLPSMLAQVGPVALALSCLALAFGYGLAWLSGVCHEQRITLAIEVGIQNAGTALLVTGGLLQNAEMSASALIYGVLMQLPAAMILLARNRSVWMRPLRAQQG
ncbi:bile acid:sodium symporter family protein [Marinobacterium weihaiense]|uniref:Bile acid:sodium symporter n=1 Tax=Marinobacterium weihaiense TaxID=2851016 RepID=A0ABS6M7V0_9GAMM|nr:bile acid:sodium symporter [Marinobacterium weihaiense]MBV0931984.1 bile acid:sodium symporter [Marinobacterium weihaiense]